MTHDEWVIALDDEGAVARLKMALFLGDQANRAGPRGGRPEETLELLVDRFVGLRVEVFAREHPPPHFRVSCDRESANYRIADCVQLNGGLRREYGTIREWHADNKQRLIDAWNRLRPTDCPVGKYREA